MAFPVFSPSVNPAFPLDVEHNFRVNTAKFGDGYEQTSPDGLNAHEKNLTLMWESITKAERDEIVDFLVARQGSEPFTCTLDGTSYTLKCSKIQDAKETANSYAVTAECRRVFDIE